MFTMDFLIGNGSKEVEFSLIIQIHGLFEKWSLNWMDQY